ncbi:MAG: molybdopterin molybdotransferase MoeA [Elusimicrobia bacterium]|nr:molybdopterin molybdotransferase MoeA [Elusimicrobiota bacterium]
MIPFAEAQAAVARAARPLDAEPVLPARALGRVLAEDLRAREDLPAFDNSAMDGYAVRSADLSGAGPGSPAVLRVLGRVAAGGLAEEKVRRGTAVPIMTGAPLPPGADTVVMNECARRVNGEVRVFVEACPGTHVRHAGEDVKRGAPLLSAGAALRAYEVALLCAQGFPFVRVVRRPRAAVLPTGSELGTSLRDSNGPALSGLLGRWGARVRALPAARDDAAALSRALKKALSGTDLLVVTGGVSAGDFDLTRPALESLGFSTLFHGVAIKPGKPLLFGARGRTLVFGLPGNPVAALLCAEEFVRPALEGLQGRRGGPPSYHMRGVLAEPYPGTKGRRHYVFCSCRREEGRFLLTPIRPQGAAMLGMACRAQALAVSPEGESLEAGRELEFRWLK